MPIQIVMPTLSPTMDKGKLAKWRVREGQQVKPGDVIAEVETDKATIEIEAVDAGRVGKLLVAEGTVDVKVNTPIAFLEGEATQLARAGGLSQRVGAVRPLSAPRPITGAPPSRPATGQHPPPPEVVPTARPGDVPPSGGGAPAGTVIGRARLKGDHGTQVQGATTIGAVNPTVSMGGQAKTQYIRAAGLEQDPVAGWVVVVAGQGRGDFRPVFVGMNSVGRDPTQRISLSFGDDSISREEHAFITYDEESRTFYLQHGGKPNIIRLMGKPVLTPMQLQANDLIRIGKTTLRFIPCCGPHFSWSDDLKDG
jgi:pyruvate/2-oxoglutarate dehydrogenase complex dihydrolipoamide acyltransferase (E2) component